MMDEDHEDLVALNTFTSVIPESRRQANLDAYVSLWLMVLRMKLDASTLGERRDEEEEADHHGAADTLRLIEAGVCISKATSQVLWPKEYRLQWPGRERRRIGRHQQVALTPFAENLPDEPYYLKVTSKKKKHDYSTGLRLNLQTSEIHIV